MRLWALVVTLGVGGSASAHRVDEYLQATIISLGKDHIRASVLLMPGVAVFPKVMRLIDTDGDGKLSAREQKSYGARVVRDLSLSVDGKRLQPRVRSIKFPTVDLMKKGVGTIEMKLEAAVPVDTGSRSLEFENRHEPEIGAYLVNCLEPNAPSLRVTDQSRNYRQSVYELLYVQGK